MAAQPRSGDSASFGALLRQHRLERGLSQEALADKAGVSLRGISDLERGARRAPHPATIGRLAAALELDAAARSSLVAAGRRGLRSERTVTVTATPAPAWPALPAALSSFVGRTEELSEIQGLLASTRLLTLAGAGGIGKTRLALEVARRGIEAGTESAFVELAPLAPVDAAVDQAIAAGLGLADRAGQGPLRAHVANAIAAHDVLVVLDNCEHLVEACASAVDYLLRTCPRLRVLATSREPLGVGGEVVWRVPTAGRPGYGIGLRRRRER